MEDFPQFPAHLNTWNHYNVIAFELCLPWSALRPSAQPPPSHLGGQQLHRLAGGSTHLPLAGQAAGVPV